jgi:hypothetical protein
MEIATCTMYVAQNSVSREYKEKRCNLNNMFYYEKPCTMNLTTNGTSRGQGPLSSTSNGIKTNQKYRQPLVSQ